MVFIIYLTAQFEPGNKKDPTRFSLTYLIGLDPWAPPRGCCAHAGIRAFAHAVSFVEITTPYTLCGKPIVSFKVS